MSILNECWFFSDLLGHIGGPPENLLVSSGRRQRWSHRSMLKRNAHRPPASPPYASSSTTTASFSDARRNPPGFGRERGPRSPGRGRPDLATDAGRHRHRRSGAVRRRSRNRFHALRNRADRPADFRGDDVASRCGGLAGRTNPGSARLPHRPDGRPPWPVIPIYPCLAAYQSQRLGKRKPCFNIQGKHRHCACLVSHCADDPYLCCKPKCRFCAVTNGLTPVSPESTWPSNAQTAHVIVSQYRSDPATTTANDMPP